MKVGTMPKKTEKSHDSLLQGLVMAYFGKSVTVKAADGQEIPCHLRRNQEVPVVGDRVTYALEPSGEAGVVTGILPRESVLARGETRSGGGQMKPIAANIDRMLVVMTPPPVLSEYLIDRYLVAANILNIQPMIVLNKSDLLDEALREDSEKRLQVYQDMGVPTLITSVKDNSGMPALAKALDQHRAVLVGPSGAGKSSIIAELSGIDSIKIGEVSSKGAGKHTTTGTRLYQLAGGGDLIDSPGVREFNLWPVTAQELIKGFPEFAEYIGGCRFKDCSHAVEPGCAVQQAVDDGKISPLRFENYKELLKNCIKPEDQYK